MKLEKWQQLQKDVKNFFAFNNAEETKASGAVKGNGDVKSDNFLFECKYRNTKGFTIKSETFKKIDEEAKLLGRTPALVTRNSEGETLITLKFYDFGNIAHDHYNYNN